MKDRIAQIMRKEGLTNAEFAEKIDISTSSLSHIFSGRNKPSLDVITRIHKAYPYINLYWLVNGEGEMEVNHDSNEESSSYEMLSETTENAKYPSNYASGIEIRKENPSEQSSSGTKDTVKEEVRYIEKPHPKITEIRIFFDNGTYQVFKGEK